MFYLAEIRESDGNDCTVYDAIVEADSQEAASDKLHKEIEAAWANLESDGGFGYFFPCDCPESEDGYSDCSHGGILAPEPEGYEAYETFEKARDARRIYHCRFNF